MMLRTITILILLLTGLPRVGVQVLDFTSDQSCMEQSCQPIEIPQGCCELTQAAAEPEFCPMSDGPCVCMVSTKEAPKPQPKAPAPSSGPELVLGLPTARPSIRVHPNDRAQAITKTAGITHSLSALRSHNETQALLGIWRT